MTDAVSSLLCRSPLALEVVFPSPAGMAQGAQGALGHPQAKEETTTPTSDPGFLGPTPTLRAGAARGRPQPRGRGPSQQASPKEVRGSAWSRGKGGHRRPSPGLHQHAAAPYHLGTRAAARTGAAPASDTVLASSKLRGPSRSAASAACLYSARYRFTARRESAELPCRSAAKRSLAVCMQGVCPAAQRAPRPRGSGSRCQLATGPSQEPQFSSLATALRTVEPTALTLTPFSPPLVACLPLQKATQRK